VEIANSFHRLLLLGRVFLTPQLRGGQTKAEIKTSIQNTRGLIITQMPKYSPVRLFEEAAQPQLFLEDE
jgi:hypothetical protein